MSDARPAHSVIEAVLFVEATPCPSCGRGPVALRSVTPLVGGEASGTIAVGAGCGACGASTEYRFAVSASPGQDAGGVPDDWTRINPTEDPSRILDVGQWLMLFRLFEERRADEPGKIAARLLGLKAAACLDEALKFHDDPENDLPPASAIFTESTRHHFLEAPEHFSRRRLVELRARLPTSAGGRSKKAGP